MIERRKERARRKRREMINPPSTSDCFMFIQMQYVNY